MGQGLSMKQSSILLFVLLLFASVSLAAAGDLELQSNRFQVIVAWKTPAGATGAGQGIAVTSDSGYFWFFDPANVELILKVLDGCALNQHFWVFAGGLTNVNTTITVIDVEKGVARTYTNPQSTPFQPIQDTSAFACP